MTYAGSIFLIALGAILRYATNLHLKGISVDTIGLILMIAGIAGLLIAFFQDIVWSERARRRRVVVEDPRVDPRVDDPRYRA